MVAATTETPSFEDLDASLANLHAKLGARAVHALVLGALTSPRGQIRLQDLLGTIMGDAPAVDAPLVKANAGWRVLFGYWNSLVVERTRGLVRFAPDALPADPTRADLLAYATRRHEELEWFVRGLDAAGNDPIPVGAGDEELRDTIALASGYLQWCVEWLGRESASHSELIQQTGVVLVELVANLEHALGDLRIVNETGR